MSSVDLRATFFRQVICDSGRVSATLVRRFRGRRAGRPGLALVVLSVIEQRLDAVRAVLDGAGVTEVAARLGVHRSTVHRCVASRASGRGPLPAFPRPCVARPAVKLSCLPASRWAWREGGEAASALAAAVATLHREPASGQAGREVNRDARLSMLLGDWARA